MHKIQIKASKTASVYTLGNNVSDKAIILLHGYGQLASEFLSKFEALCDEGWYLIAPEGLSMFYLEGFKGKTGASWMTSENRESEIDDYLQYLELMHSRLIVQKTKDLRLLGFSQGVTTAFRWMVQSSIGFKQCIAHSGMIPEDIQIDALDQFIHTDFHYISGKRDPYLAEPEVARFRELMERNTSLFRITEFEGGHRVDIESVRKVLRLPEG
jgi:predicted esterase